MAIASPSITQLSTSTLCLTRRSIYLNSSSSFRSAPLSISHQHCFAFSKLTKRPLNFISAANLPFDLSPPPIDHDLLDTTISAGAVVSEDGIVETFNNDDEALDRVDKGTVVVDLSHYGRIRVSGEDRAHFLHNQSTADFDSLREGQGCDTVFVTPTARTIDIAHAWIMKTAITLVVSPEISRSITEMLDKYIFFTDKVEVEDITTRTKLFVLVGPSSNKVISNLNMGDLVGQPYGSHKHYSVNRMPVTVAVGNIVSEEGFSLMMAPAVADSVWKALLGQGAIPMGSNAWEKLRILQGRPVPGKELTNEYNVLEAGLWNSISLDKGCYKGQETIARLITYDGIKQRLWGIHLSSPVKPGSSIAVDGKKVGKLTSYTATRKNSEHFGLGYIKRSGASEGDLVTVGDNVVGKLVKVPYIAHQRQPKQKAKS
ncbi:Glycine cleavage T-protein aminomethyltransferase [Heracleum sosnowskyi]|uniref:Glycine cleavage T-protein aminomethyltransferase n=1 Tax=Heracleum sosnowskyi TaxID=360622 RepID=A0AAD8HWJ5_9APIA|nr:Glycine cleavage T-protein aminomethyltransferase [Heracleum sosnowskyi]